MSNKTILSTIIIPAILAISLFILDTIGVITPGRDSWGTGDSLNIFYAIPGIFLLFFTIPVLFKQSYKDFPKKIVGWKWKLISIIPVLIFGILFTFPLIYNAFYPITLSLVSILILTIFYLIKANRNGYSQYKTSLLYILETTILIIFLIVSLFYFIVFLN